MCGGLKRCFFVLLIFGGGAYCGVGCRDSGKGLVEDAKDVFVITSFEGQGIMIGEDLEQQDAPLDEQETDSDSGAVSAAEPSSAEDGQ